MKKYVAPLADTYISHLLKTHKAKDLVLRYMSGAKAMAMHVKTKAVIPMMLRVKQSVCVRRLCKFINKFVRHVGSLKLVNEDNSDIVEAVRTKLAERKNTVKLLPTLKGYNNFQITEQEKEEKSVDITEKFSYNTFTTEELTDVQMQAYCS